MATIQGHTPECDAAQRKSKEAIATWRAKWPNACSACGGWGGFYYAGSRDEPPGVDPCEECLGKGKCPRCGAATMPEGDEAKCSACGFDVMKPDGCPEPAECGCWEDEP